MKMFKHDLLEIMKRYGACHNATVWVTHHECSYASVIVGSCINTAWLIWLLGRERRLDRFARVCARRAIRMQPSKELEVQQRLGRACMEQDPAMLAVLVDDLSHQAGWAAYDVARGYSFERSNARTAERDKQLVGLQRIGRNWANGLPAER